MTRLVDVQLKFSPVQNGQTLAQILDTKAMRYILRLFLKVPLS